MSINVKKYTKDQMLKMVVDAQAEVQELRLVNAALTEQISQMNGESINKANEIANLKADADALRNKLADTEAALGRANALCAQFQSNLTLTSETCYNATQRADYAESHPWRNLWRNGRTLLKRKLGGERNEHVS